jgi:3-isopropylmalate/(R)-2-methylmalate dehydratase large subunit
MTVVCGDSHTATHGALGAVAFGIGTSEVEMVMATQCLIQRRPLTFRIRVDAALNSGVTPKDLILYILSKLGTRAGTGYFIEFSGEAIRNMSMEGRMTICNMAIEMGARSGLITPDEITYSYLQNRDFAPTKEAWENALEFWKSLASDPDAQYDREASFDASLVPPMITWGTNPGWLYLSMQRYPMSTIQLFDIWISGQEKTCLARR